jgi:hypothetical protein
MAHEYEYAVSVDYFTPVKGGGSPNYTEEPARVAFLIAFRNLANKLPRAIDTTLGDGWSINSHSITFQGEVAIVSILLQRHRT